MIAVILIIRCKNSLKGLTKKRIINKYECQFKNNLSK